MSTEGKPPRRRRLVRWLVRLAIVAIVARLLLALLLGWFVDKAARSAGLTVDYRTASLSFHRLSLHFDDVVARDPDDEGVPALFTAQQIDADVSMWRLLHGEIVVVDMALAGARVHVERRADGSLRLPAAWSVLPPPEPRGATPAPTPVRFDLPARIVSARLHDVQVIVEDLQRATPTRDEFTVDVDVQHLGDPSRPGSIAVRADAPQLFDRGWLHAEATTAEQALTITWRGGIRGVRSTLPGVRTFAVEMSGELATRRDDQYPTAALVSGNVHVDVQADDEPFLAMDVKSAEPTVDGDALVIPFGITATGPRMVDDLAIANGSCRWSPARTTLAAELRCRGLSLQRVAPRLATMGVELPADGIDADAALHVDVVTATGTPAISARLENVAFGRGDERTSLRNVAITDLRHVDDQTSVGRIELMGPRLAVTRSADGTFSIAGIRFRTTQASPTPAPASTTASVGAARPQFPAVVVHELDWRGLEVTFTDATLPQPATLRLLEGAVQGQDLALRDGARPGRCNATFMIEDAIGGLHANTELRSGDASLTANVTLTANDITLHAFAPWLARAGITPALDGASGRAMVSCTITKATDAITVDTSLSSVQLQDRGEALLSVRTVQSTGLRLDAAGLHLGRWTAMDPYVIAHRVDDGTVRACGLAFGPRPKTTATTPPPTTATATATTTATTAPPSVAVANAPQRPRLAHGGFEVRGAAVRWIDAGRTPALDATLGIALRIGADPGDGTTVPFDAELRLGRAIESCTVQGTYRRDDTTLRLDGTLDGKSLRGDALSTMLPASLQCTLAEGSLRGHVLANVTFAPTAALDLRVDSVRLADRDVESFAIDSLVLDAPHLASDRVHVRRLQITGLRAMAASAADGLHVPGFLLRHAPLDATPPPAPHPAVGTAPPPPAPRATSFPVPALRIDEFDVGIEQFTWRDRSGDEGRPVVANARLRLREPWSTAADLADTEPARFELVGAVDPLCREGKVDVSIAPFELRPTLDLVVRATGIDTTALATVAPRLAKDLTGLAANATFEASAHATLDLRRPTANVLPIGQPFGAEISIEGLRFVDANGPPLAAIPYAEVEIRSFDPRTGDLLVRSIEVDDPQLRVERSPAGVDALGLRWLPHDAPPPANGAAPTPPPPSPPATATAAAATGPEFAIERLRVQGLSLDITDTTTEPASRLPLRDGDLAMQNVSTKALAAARPVAFTFSASGGEVELERRVLRSSAIAGLLGSAAEAIAGKADRHTMEQRPWFDELRVVGQLALQPRAKGQVRTMIRSLELPALRGLGKRGGVELADGVYDLDVTADLRDGAGLHLSSKSVFTWLSLTEPPGGPISTYLRLPAPLDTVLFLLRNDEDEHVIPLDVELSPERASGGELAGAAAEALARIFADAIASASLRTAGALTGAVGIGGAAGPLPTAQLPFAAGASVPPSTGLDEVVLALQDDARLDVSLTHELGSADLQRAAELANPAPAVVAATLVRMRAERDTLASQRRQMVTDVDALYSAGRMQDAEARHDALAALDARIGELERTIDESVRMLAGENERQRSRRTRQAALAIAERRLHAVQDAIAARVGPSAAARIEWRRPRAVPAMDAPDGGRVVVTVRRRAAQ